MKTDKLQRAEELIERFFDGNTSQTEERELYAFFADAANVPEHLRQYAGLFRYMADEMPAELDAAWQMSVMLPKSRNIRVLWTSIAAAVVVLIGLLLPHILDNGGDIDTYAGSYIRRNGKILTNPSVVRQIAEATVQEAFLQMQLADSIRHEAEGIKDRLAESFDDPYTREAVISLSREQ
jgi:hypothetical protein